MSTFNFKDIISQFKDLGYSSEQILENLSHSFDEEAEAKSKPDPLDEKYPHLKDGFVEWVQSSNGPKMRPCIYELVNFVINEYSFTSTQGVNYIWSGKHYRQIVDLEGKKLIIELTKEKFTHQQISNAYQILISKAYEDYNNLNTPDGKINFNNCVYDLKKQTTESHNPEYFFKSCIEHDYVEDAKCPGWMQFLNEVFMNNQEMVDMAQDIFGYAMIGGDPFLHKAFILYGDGRNGKGVFLKTLEHVLGKENISSVSMKDLDRPFSVVRMDGKLANIVGETPSGNGKIDSERFKSAVAGEYITAAHKTKPEFDLKVNARLFFACNRLPNFGETSDGIFERLVILPFVRFFRDNERNPNIFNEKILPDMPGIINWALEGAQNVLKNKRIRYAQSSIDEVDNFVDEVDTVRAFFNAKCKIEPEDQSWVKGDEVYSAYKLFCSKREQYPLSRVNFARKISNIYKAHGHHDRIKRFNEGVRYQGLHITDRNVFFLNPKNNNGDFQRH